MNIKYGLIVCMLMCGCEKYQSISTTQTIYDINICKNNIENKSVKLKNLKDPVKWMHKEQIEEYMKCWQKEFDIKNNEYNSCLKYNDSRQFKTNDQMYKAYDFCEKKLDYKSNCQYEVEQIVPTDEILFCKNLKNQCESYWKTEDIQIKNGTYKGSINNFCNVDRKNLFQKE
ncbi:MAG: hypothetical protein ABFD50_04525 [Smithella sp.]